jgi:hypothetical protein
MHFNQYINNSQESFLGAVNALPISDVNTDRTFIYSSAQQPDFAVNWTIFTSGIKTVSLKIGHSRRPSRKDFPSVMVTSLYSLSQLYGDVILNGSLDTKSKQIWEVYLL